MNFLAFFSSRLIKVLGATIEEKKTKLPIKKGIKKITKIFRISVINLTYIKLYFKKKTMVIKNKYEFKIYTINTSN